MPVPAPYTASPARDGGSMPYCRTGAKRIKLPAISLGPWKNFGGANVFETGRAILRRAFDRGVTHFDLANNYGPPYGSAEANFGRVLASDFAAHRDELIVSTKAGWDMWPGPYGDIGSSKKYLIASCELRAEPEADGARLYRHHLFAPRRSCDAARGDDGRAGLAPPPEQGALCRHLLLRARTDPSRGSNSRRGEGPALHPQTELSILNRWIEQDLLAALDHLGTGCIAFSPLAQGMLTVKYLGGVPEDARASRLGSLSQGLLNDRNLTAIRALDQIAAQRGQTLAQMAIAWVLRDPRITSALIGARTVEQLDDSLDAVARPDFSDEELATIGATVQDGGINIWSGSSDIRALPAAQGVPA